MNIFRADIPKSKRTDKISLVHWNNHLNPLIKRFYLSILIIYSF